MIKQVCLLHRGTGSALLEFELSVSSSPFDSAVSKAF